MAVLPQGLCAAWSLSMTPRRARIRLSTLSLLLGADLLPDPSVCNSVYLPNGILPFPCSRFLQRGSPCGGHAGQRPAPCLKAHPPLSPPRPQQDSGLYRGPSDPNCPAWVQGCRTQHHLHACLLLHSCCPQGAQSQRPSYPGPVPARLAPRPLLQACDAGKPLCSPGRHQLFLSTSCLIFSTPCVHMLEHVRFLRVLWRLQDLYQTPELGFWLLLATLPSPSLFPRCPLAFPMLPSPTWHLLPAPLQGAQGPRLPPHITGAVREDHGVCCWP